MDSLAIARALHVLAVVHWIGGVAAVTTIRVPAVLPLFVISLLLVVEVRFGSVSAISLPANTAYLVEPPPVIHGGRLSTGPVSCEIDPWERRSLACSDCSGASLHPQNGQISRLAAAPLTSTVIPSRRTVVSVRTVLLDDRGYVALLRLYLARAGYTAGPLFRASINGSGGPLSYDAARHRWEGYCRAAGVGLEIHQLRHADATELKVSGVASAASFGSSCERRLPAEQRAALEHARSHRSACTVRDLGCHHPLASSRTMMQPVRLQRISE